MKATILFGRAIAIAIIFSILCGCSGNQTLSPVTPSQNEQPILTQSANQTQTASPTNGHFMWGVWDCYFDPASQKMEFASLREANFHANVAGWLKPPDLSMVINHFYADQARIDLNFSIKNPYVNTNLRAFDLRGMVMGSGPYITASSDSGLIYSAPGGFQVENADGMTRWWNPLEFTTAGLYGYNPGLLGSKTFTPSTSLNPYKYFADVLSPTDLVSDKIDMTNRGTLSTDVTSTRNYIIQFPYVIGVPVYKFQYAIDANWAIPGGIHPKPKPIEDFGMDANCPEAFHVALDTTGTTSWYVDDANRGGTLALKIEVFDWNAPTNANGIDGEIDSISIESPTLFDGVINVPVESDPGSQDTSGIYKITVPNTHPTGLENQEVLVTVKSKSPTTYQPPVSGPAYPTGADLAAYALTIVPVSSDEPTTITVIAPNGGETWYVGDTQNIEWYAPSNIENVSIGLSLDSGQHFTIPVFPLNPGTPNDGVYEWTIPEEAISQHCRIRVLDAGGQVIYDDSDGDFVVKEKPSITVLAPNGGECWMAGVTENISWAATPSITHIAIGLSLDSGESITVAIVPAGSPTENDGTYEWVIPDEAVGQFCRIRVLDAENPSIHDDSDADFEVTEAPSIYLTVPNGGEVWQVGEIRNITWSGSPSITSVAIGLSLDSGQSFTIPVVPVSSPTPNDGVYEWQIPEEAIGQNCRIRVMDVDTPTVFDDSDGDFTVDPASFIQVTYPSEEGLILNVGMPCDINWDYSGITDNIQILFASDGTNFNKTISLNTPCESGVYQGWIPETEDITSNGKIEVTSLGVTPYSDISDNPFTIHPAPYIEIIAPNGGEEWDVATQHQIQWTSFDVSGMVRLEYCIDSNQIWKLIEPAVPNSGSYDWPVPNDPTDQARIKVSWASNPTYSGISDGYFSIVKNNEPPIAYAEADPESQTVCLPIHFSGEGSFDPDGGLIVKYEWDWNNDGVFDEEGEEVDHFWTTVGTFKVQLRVTDDEGSTAILNQPLQIKIENEPPSASAVVVTSPPYYVGQPITFDASASKDHDCGDQSITEYKWDWNNDHVWESSGVTASHSYPAAGTYYVQLGVVDNEGEGYIELSAPLIINVLPVSGWNNIAYTWGGTTSDHGYAVAHDDSGKIYVGGDFTGTVDFDPSSGTTSRTARGSSDAFISVFGPDGSFQRVFTWGAVGSADPNAWVHVYDLAIDSNGDLWVVGNFKGIVDFDPAHGGYVYGNHTSYDAYVSKYSATGTYLPYTGTWGGPTDYDVASGVAINQYNGWIWVTGSFAGTNVDFWPDPQEQVQDLKTSNGSSDCFLSIFYPDTSYGNAYTWGGPLEDHAYEVTTNNYTTIYVTGEFQGTNVDFHPDTGGDFHDSVGGSDAFLSSFAGSAWTKTWGGSGDDRGMDVVLGMFDGVYVTGSFSGTADFDPGPGIENHISNGGSDAFLTCGFTGMSSRTWGGTGNDYGLSIGSDTDQLNNIFVSGSFEGSVNFDQNGGHQKTSKGGSDAFLNIFDAFGYFQGVNVWGGSGQDTATNVDLPGTDYAFIIGNFNSTVDFDPGYSIENHTSNGSDDVFLSRLPTTDMPDPLAPIACATPTPNPAVQNVGQPIHFDGSCSYDPDGGTIQSYQWDWNNDGTFDETGQTVDHSWTSPGTYYVQLKVTDSDDGLFQVLTTPIQVTINYVPDPTISITNPYSGITPWEVGDSQYITWTSQDLSGTLTIACDSGSGFINIVNGVPVSDGSYFWSNIPYSAKGANVRIKVTPDSAPSAFDISDYFAIVDCGEGFLTGEGSAEIIPKWQNMGGSPILGCADATGIQYNQSTPWHSTYFYYATFGIQQASINHIESGQQAGSTWVIYGDIYDAWAAGGYASGPLGLPIEDQQPYSGSRLWQEFEWGGISYIPGFGAHRIQGAIFNYWKTTGMMNGLYGGAKTDEISTGADGSVRQDYEYGSLCFNGTTGSVYDCNQTQNLSYWIAWVAQNEWAVGDYIDPSVYGCYQGCCKTWADVVTDSAQDHAGCPGSGLPPGTTLGTQIPFEQAIAGDMLQLGFYDSGYHGIVHTAIVLSYKGNGVFHVIDCNWCHGNCNLISVHDIDTKLYNQQVVNPRVYRIECD